MMLTKLELSHKLRKFESMCSHKISWFLVSLISVLVLVVSCANNDELDAVDEQLTNDNNLPIIDNNSTNNNSTSNNEGSIIIYTDLEPNYTDGKVGEFKSLDINNDGIMDFTFRSIDATWSFYCEPNSNSNQVNGFVAVSGPFESYAVPLNEKSIISYKLDFAHFFDWYGGYLAMDFCDTFPLYCPYGWGGKMDKYVGLRFLINNQTHYGWVRLDV